MRTSDARGAQRLDVRNIRKTNRAGRLRGRIHATGANATEPQRLGAAEPQPEFERPLNRRDAKSAEKTASEKTLLEMRDSFRLHCEERRGKSKVEGAQSERYSVTCLQVAGRPLAPHCNGGSCSQAATNLRKETNHGIREIRGRQTESWPERIMQRGRSRGQSSMILSGDDSAISGCGFAALRSSQCKKPESCSSSEILSCCLLSALRVSAVQGVVPF